MSTKNGIAIGKGLGHLLKIEDASVVTSTFRSYLKILVEIDSLKPLKPGFSLARPDGATSWVSLKYERLDAYCIDCGVIGHKQMFCQAPQTDRFPAMYKFLLKSPSSPTSSLHPHWTITLIALPYHPLLKSLLTAWFLHSSISQAPTPMQATTKPLSIQLPV